MREGALNPFGSLYQGQFALSAVWVFKTDQGILRQSALGNHHPSCTLPTLKG
jgi:hypothetical protein